MQWLVDIHLGIAIVLGLGALMLTIQAFSARKAGNLSEGFYKGFGHFERLVVLQAVIGIVLYLSGLRSLDHLHYLYGGILLVFLAIGRGLRPGRSLREAMVRDYGWFNEPAVFGWLSLLMFLVIGRAITTGWFGF